MAEEFDVVAPDSGAMIESMRAFGYDLPTAIADLIDNSISAEARNIWVDFSWSGGNSRIAIRDDGSGMTEGELIQAMKLGSISPLEVRAPSDLGRFGLGLKTASFSQARRLVVLTKSAEGGCHVRCWDLDYVVNSCNGEWRLLKLPERLESAEAAELDELETGTIVFLEALDRVVGDISKKDKLAQRHFRERIDDVKGHLGMVFHRYLTGRGAIRINVNGSPVDPWDPFLEGDSDPLPSETLLIDGEEVKVSPFVLPHHSRISSEMHKAAAGPKGWNAQQGFYVYRNRRLIVSGDWLGLGVQKEEHYKLARIMVDLPNSMDQMWHLDVRKARANPPSSLRTDMKRIARATREKASKVYRHRGKILQRKHSDDFVFVWSPKVRGGKTYYKINRKHPLIERIVEETPNRDRFSSMISLIEQSVPSPLIVIQNSEEPDSLGQPFEDEPKALIQAMRDVFQALLDKGETVASAAEKITVMDPFTYHPDVVAVFLEELNQQQ